MRLIKLSGSAAESTSCATSSPGSPRGARRWSSPPTTPTFIWSKASGAAKYQVRVYKGSTLLLTKTGITGLSWKSSKALPKNVSLLRERMG